MGIRDSVRIVICAGAALLSSLPAAAEKESGEPELRLELPRRDRPRRIVRELLGRNRVRSVNLTRYRMELLGLGLDPEPTERRPALEDAEEVLLSSFLRVSRERIERELLLKERYDAWRGRMRGREIGAAAPGPAGGLGLRVSPRAYLVDGDALVGAKLRLKGLRSPLWSRAGLGVTHELSGDDLRLELSVTEPRWATRLVFHSAHRRRGQSAEAWIGVTF